MASLVTEVLMNTGLLEKEDLATRIDKVSSQINELKAEISVAQRKRSVDFIPCLDNMEKLHTRVKSLDTEMQDLGSKIKGNISVKLKTSTSDVQKLSKELEKSNATIEVLMTLYEVHKHLKEFNLVLQFDEFVQAVDILQSLKGHLSNLSQSGYSEMKIMQTLSREESVMRETLFYHLGEYWSKTITFKTPASSKGKGSKSAGFSNLVISPNDKFQCTLQAMETTQCLPNKLEAFGKKLLENILYPLIRRTDVQPVIDSQKQTISLMKVEAKEPSAVPNPATVYQGILRVLEALSPQLLGHTVRQGTSGEEMTDVSIMSMLGSLIWPSIAKTLIKDCLIPSTPANTQQLDEYKEIFEATRQFEESLQGLGFIEGEIHPLTDFGKNANVHFANKRCQELLVEARRLIKEELHNMVEVGSTKPAAEEEGSGEEKNPLGPGMAAFPRCFISRSVQQLMELCAHTLHEASTCKEQCFQLFYTVRNMLELFCEAVPHYHKANLTSLPAVAAVHHNNCMYITHLLPTLGHRYQHTFHASLSDGASTFVDLIPVLRREAATHFLAQMRFQRDLLLESLQLAGGFQRVAEEVITATKAIKQVIHRMTQLKTVLGDILPANVYQKTMATLVNTVLMHVVEHITRLEDISAEDATHLHIILTKLRNESPDLLKPPKSEEPVTIEVLVKQWGSFTELLFIMEASMQAIVDRWADGKGPLALVFPATTVKSLIRALFQNTDRRANALSKIRQT